MATEPLHDLEQQAWEGFLRAHDRLSRALETGLNRVNVSLSEYSVLALLGTAGPDGKSMTALAEQRLMSSGGFTRLADRLERRGLIERKRSATDGRGFNATLTRSGRALLRKARRQHHSDLRALFFDHLNDDDLRYLADVWNRLDPSSTADDADTAE